MGNAGYLDVISLAGLLGLFFISWLIRLSSRVLIIAGLITLLAAAVGASLGYDVEGTYIAIAAYFFLIVGVVTAVSEYLREREAQHHRFSQFWRRLERFRIHVLDGLKSVGRLFPR